MPSLLDQLDAGVQGLELDIHYERLTGIFYNLHIPAVDSKSSCYCVSDCFAEVNDFQSRNPAHLPIIFVIEPKYDGELDGICQRGRSDAQILLLLENMLSNIVGGKSKVVSPSAVQRNYSSLQEAIDHDGWPSLQESRGKVMFYFNNKPTGNCGLAYAAVVSTL
jgi:hypothetical protein